MKLFYLAPEQIMFSYNNLTAYIEWLRSEKARARERVAAYIEGLRAEEPLGESEAKLLEERLSQARFYVRPYRKAAELGRLGYDEAGFYSFRQGTQETV